MEYFIGVHMARPKKRAGPIGLRWVRRMAEGIPKAQYRRLGYHVRGFYALLKKVRGKDAYHVVYVGIAKNLRKRLYEHGKWGAKRDQWTHFCAFQVWPNVIEEEIREIEGILRQIYRRDPHANRFNKQKKMWKLGRVRDDDLESWPQTSD